MNLFGPIVDGGQVEAAAKATLGEWMPAYLAEMERQTGRAPESLPMVRGWETAPEFDKWPETQLPCGIIICPGTADEPTEDGQQMHRAKWDLHVALVVSANTEANTLALSKVYAAAARATLRHHGTLGGFALRTKWVGEGYTDLPLDKRRSMASGEAVFVVEVDDVLDGNGGPSEPPADPYEDPGDWPDAETAEATVDQFVPDV